MLKTRFLKCLRNKKDYSKNGPKRKQEKRQASSDENSSVGNQTSANVDNHFNNELSPDFLKRRAILEENKNASLFAIIELVPVYKNIEMVSLVTKIQLRTRTSYFTLLDLRGFLTNGAS